MFGYYHLLHFYSTDFVYNSFTLKIPWLEDEKQNNNNKSTKENS